MRKPHSYDLIAMSSSPHKKSQYEVYGSLAFSLLQYYIRVLINIVYERAPFDFQNDNSTL